MKKGPVLLTGSSGFVGSNVYLALAEKGYEVRCATRSPERADKMNPGRPWVVFDSRDPRTWEAALAGCTSAVWLLEGVHGDVDEEVAVATRFRDAASAAGVERLAWLGGLPPAGADARVRLRRSRVRQAFEAGELTVTTLEPSFLVGFGLWRWNAIRDHAARAPVLVLPKEADIALEPLAVEDLGYAVAAALSGEFPAGAWALPGPERVTLGALLRRTAAHMGRDPFALPVPLHLPRLSRRWLGLATRAGGRAAELLDELAGDVVADDHSVFPRIGHTPLSLDQAIAIAVELDPAPGHASLLELVAQRVTRRTAA